MTVYAYPLTQRQAAIRDDVCQRAATLHDRLQDLGHRAAYGLTDFDDAAAVRTWLFTMHHGELPASVPPGGDQ